VPANERNGASSVVMLSNHLWRTRLASDRTVTESSRTRFPSAPGKWSCAVLAACLLPLRRALRFDPIALFKA
jgi:hypothetical protein